MMTEERAVRHPPSHTPAKQQVARRVASSRERLRRLRRRVSSARAPRAGAHGVGGTRAAERGLFQAADQGAGGSRCAGPPARATRRAGLPVSRAPRRSLSRSAAAAAPPRDAVGYATAGPITTQQTRLYPTAVTHLPSLTPHLGALREGPRNRRPAPRRPRRGAAGDLAEGALAPGDAAAQHPAHPGPREAADGGDQGLRWVGRPRARGAAAQRRHARLRRGGACQNPPSPPVPAPVPLSVALLLLLLIALAGRVLGMS